MADWNARRYHELSTPQQAWGQRLLERLELSGAEHALDIGCGTGRLTAELATRLPAGSVVGLDFSETMLETAQAWLRANAPRVTLVRGDAARLPFVRAFDIVFSGATFHWVLDHGALFRSIVLALRRGGRLLAQCGGGPNIATLRARADALAAEPRYAQYFDEWTAPWYYADEETTRRRLRDAGFVDIEVWLENTPAPFESAETYADFIATVCVRHHLERLPRSERPGFVRELTLLALRDTPPLTLDYWRLNMSARRPA